MPHTKANPVVNTRIQARNKELILEAALDVFSASGFRGATVDQIAAKSKCPSPTCFITSAVRRTSMWRSSNIR